MKTMKHNPEQKQADGLGDLAEAAVETATAALKDPNGFVAGLLGEDTKDTAPPGTLEERLPNNISAAQITEISKKYGNGGF